MYFPILPRPGAVAGTPLIHSKPLAPTAPAGLVAARANAPHFTHG